MSKGVFSKHCLVCLVQIELEKQTETETHRQKRQTDIGNFIDLCTNPHRVAPPPKHIDNCDAFLVPHLFGQQSLNKKLDTFKRGAFGNFYWVVDYVRSDIMI